MLPIRIVGEKSAVDTFAFLDDGATVSIIDKSIARKAGISGKRTSISIVGIKGEKIPFDKCEKLDFTVKGHFGHEKIIGAVTADKVAFPKQTISTRLLEGLKIPPHVHIQEYYNAKAGILIGQDNWNLITPSETLRLKNNSVAASRTALGWTLHGPIINSVKSSGIVHLTQNVEALKELELLENLDKLVKGYFELESIGVQTEKTYSTEYDRAYKILNETSQFKGDHWETGLLWRHDFAPDVDSYPMAMKRLELLEKIMNRDPDYGRRYRAEMQRFIDMGYAVKIDKTKEAERVWYLPHFGVQNINKPDKIRLVFDAAAKSKGISLNDQLDSGPDLLQSLPGVLIRFRQYAVALSGDIKDMFLRVKIRKEDRGAQRFLWRDGNSEKEPDVYEMLTLIFGSKASPCSAIFVKNKNAKTFKVKNAKVLKGIIKDTYVDNFLTSCENAEEAEALMRDVIRVNSIAGFFMHSWTSNEKKIRGSQIGKSEMQLCDQENERVLGLFWDTENDFLKFNVHCKKIPREIMDGSRRPTKREILRVVMSVFDPLGLLAPYTMKAKLLLQEIWRSGIGWDEKVKDNEYEAWLTWVEGLKLIQDCRVLRCISPVGKSYKSIQLHVFCDASLSAFATAVYLRFEIENASAYVTLVMAKSRVAPLKPMTVPRLELQAALLGARVAKYVCQECEYKISRRYLWSDSSTVLGWIRSEPRTRQVFVAHRLGEIAELTSVAEWHWVPSKENPADDATRFSTTTLCSTDRWFTGPPFLHLPPSDWPKEKSISAEEKASIDQLEARKVYVGVVSAIPESSLSLPIRLLGWQGLLITARRIYGLVKRRIPYVNKPTDLELKKICENYWYREVQRECFTEEIISLEAGKKLSKNSRILSLNPYLDKNNIVRANGRVKSELLGDFNNQPIILHGKHFAIKALIKDYHRRFHHGSNDAVMNELRQNYYIIGLRAVLRSISSRCIVCRLQRGKPFDPIMGNLPQGRMAYRQRPFSHCGIDYFGPMVVAIGRRREKRWGALFTCLTTRAVHIELAHTLNADSAIMAIQRLAARRGAPLSLYSDCGTNFKAADKELREAIKSIDNKKMSAFALNKNILWHFNSPDAAFQGGIWERLVREIKTALRVILKEQAPREEVLITVLTEAEHSVNSRPLTHVSLDPRDNEALTPNHFLIGTSSAAINLGNPNPKTICHRKQWRIAQQFADAFWKRWLREYLPNLITRQKWKEQGDPIKLDDIVLIVDLQAPRNTWRKGHITRIFPGNDGETRVAEVQTPMGTYIRPVRRLIKLLGSTEV